jgi:hypothetical protein
MADKRPPRILQIYRDSLTRGSENVFKLVEEDAARICAQLNCANVPLAMESLTGPISATSEPDTTLFAVRPYWGMPAQEWIAADPEFWKLSPMARVS